MLPALLCDLMKLTYFINAISIHVNNVLTHKLNMFLNLLMNFLFKKGYFLFLAIELLL